MNILSSSSPFPFVAHRHPLLSPQPTFHIPQHKSLPLNPLPIQPNHSNSFVYPQVHENDFMSSGRAKPLSLRAERYRLTMPEPVKKVKVENKEWILEKTKPYQLKIEEVFRTKKEPVNTDKSELLEYESDGDSGLSFLSSSSASLNLDNNEEDNFKEAIKDDFNSKLRNSSNKNQARNVQGLVKKEEFIREEEHEDQENMLEEPLFVKDRISNNTIYGRHSELFPSLINASLMFPTQQMDNIQHELLLQKLHHLNYIQNLQSGNYVDLPQYAQHPLIRTHLINNPLDFRTQQVYPIHLNYQQANHNNLAMAALLQDHHKQYAEQVTRMGSMESMMSEQIMDKLIREECFESDYCATRSTSIDQEQLGNEICEKSHKESPVYLSNDEDLTVDGKVQKRQVKRKENKKKAGENRDSKERTPKEKKARALNLEMTMNPKHLKIERRRLNRLQLIKYQQEGIEDEGNLVKLINGNHIYSPGNETSTSDSPQTDIEVDFFEGHKSQAPVCYESLKAEIPPFAPERYRRDNVCKEIWNPSEVDFDALERFVQQLSTIVEYEVSDQEAVIKLLNAHEMDAMKALETVRENKAFYVDTLRLKIKKVSRRRY